jgi:hypothetical protein
MRLRCWRNALPGVQFCRAADVAGGVQDRLRQRRLTPLTCIQIGCSCPIVRLAGTRPRVFSLGGSLVRHLAFLPRPPASHQPSRPTPGALWTRRREFAFRGMTFVRKVARANSTNRLNCRTVGSCGRSRIDRQHNDDDAGRRSTATTCESSTPLGSRTIGARGSLRGTNNNRGEIEAAAVLTLCYDRRIVIAPPLRDGMAAPTCQSCQ